MSLNEAQFGNYMGGHRPAEPDDGVGAPFHRADDVMPDVTGPKGMQYYDHHRDGRSAESFQQMRAAKGNPDALVKIYRSVPKAEMGINHGDWVTPSRAYAVGHGLHADDPSQDWPVIEGTAKASELWGHGDDPNEWGYWRGGKK